MVVTDQYLIGELSQRLGQLAATMPDASTTGEVVLLRRSAETCPFAELATVLRRALRVADAACWRSLAAGDTTTFARQSHVSTDLHGFGVCAGLIDDG